MKHTLPLIALGACLSLAAQALPLDAGQVKKEVMAYRQAVLTEAANAETALPGDASRDREQVCYAHFKAASDLLDQGKPFRALARLTADTQSGLFDNSTDYATYLRARLLAAYGLHDQADRLLDVISNAGIVTANPAIATIQLVRAYHAYQTGAFEQVKSILNGAGLYGLPDSLQDQRKLVLANAYTLSGDLVGAKAALDAVPDNGSGALYADYNKALLLIRAKQTNLGEAALRRVMTDHAASPDAAIIRDRARLVLALTDLQDKDAALAIDTLAHMPQDSLFAEDALLYLGLAYQTAKEPERAMTAWEKLATHDASSAAVQAALLWAPHLAQQQGDLARAQQGYARAIASYQGQMAALDTLIEHRAVGITLSRLSSPKNPMERVVIDTHGLGAYRYPLVDSDAFGEVADWNMQLIWLAGFAGVSLHDAALQDQGADIVKETLRLMDQLMVDGLTQRKASLAVLLTHAQVAEATLSYRTLKTQGATP